MFSLLFGKKSTSNGVGYGGSVTTDFQQLKKGREIAAAQQSARDAATIGYLIQTGPLLRSKTLTDTSKLVSTLKHVFRNQVPTEWAKRKKILLLSLTCLGLVLQNYHYPELLVGNVENAESLAAAFDEFAQHAHFLSRHNTGTQHAQMVKRILQLQTIMMQTSQHAIIVHDATRRVDPHLHYRKTLSPLRFAFCESLQNHVFSSRPLSTKLNMRMLFQELSAFRTCLPVEHGSSIFVRAVEGRLDLLRALIIGPQDTPYANGCFLFDIWLNDYPNKPPKVQLVTTGGGTVAFNPNLYANGKVCLSLLGTWDGPGWVKGESTLLQVLVSIQSLILVGEPFYNEPLAGMIRTLGMLHQRSVQYNANIRRHVLRHAMLPFLHGSHLYPEFRQVMQQHYLLKKSQIQVQLKEWERNDPTLASLVQQVSTKLSRRSKVDKTPRNVDSTTESDGPLRKKQKVSTT